MNVREIIAGAGENLNPIKKGRKKTLAMIKGYGMTMIAFLFAVIIVLVMEKDLLMKFTFVVLLLIMEGLFGAYTFLSLRIRQLEVSVLEPKASGRAKIK